MKFPPAMILLGMVAFAGPAPAAPEVPPKTSAQQPGRDIDTLNLQHQLYPPSSLPY